MDRRTFHRRVSGTLGAAFCCELVGPPTRVFGADFSGALAARYEKLTNDAHLGEAEVVAEVSDDKKFTEGPAVAADGSVFFTNVPASKIYRWDPASKQLEVFRESTNQANGLLFDPQGRLLACEGGGASRHTNGT